MPEAGSVFSSQPAGSALARAALLKLRGGFATGAQLDEKINREGKQATLAYPIASAMGQLFSKLGWMTAVMRLVAYLVVVVAAASLLAVAALIRAASSR